MNLTMNDFNASVLECGGVAIDADALAGTTANFSFDGKRKRIAYFDGKGNVTYQMIDKRTTQQVAYSVTEEGYLELKWPDGEVWYWSKLNETSDGWLLKTYWESKDGKEKEIFNLAVKLNK
ncbi:hypothetical protein JCM19240_2339 [Vibrio maritimus]|uniref:Uncharacterized protein n=1 Tax=Vibrio maritimus TaxID=990268 RepID=A0A090T387_9VIBR|nr:hypothetical protein JCM19240_2339 [Vibrio maritimus]